MPFEDGLRCKSESFRVGIAPKVVFIIVLAGRVEGESFPVTSPDREQVEGFAPKEWRFGLGWSYDVVKSGKDSLVDVGS